MRVLRFRRHQTLPIARPHASTSNTEVEGTETTHMASREHAWSLFHVPARPRQRGNPRLGVPVDLHSGVLVGKVPGTGRAIGAMVFVLAVGRTPRWQKLCNTGPVQYLSNISYAIYLMHGPVMHTLGYAIERRAWSITGVEGAWYS
ncbi:hypothetical protein B0H67DRAFT_661319 [Lasiosphaeris hirsuta]|uniref:Acyltransferase 3 domain-containing protein n=1 Tax=Lasiosphaeris hirsuta TaxID=260670 RepID=A0AA40APN4_9PEZI|nr:hypothetical protein B0H67DRAFT_661319 [Lasiosphaeris hirsuta]